MESNIISIEKENFKNYLQKGVYFSAYKRQMQNDLTSNPDSQAREYINLNLHRMLRIGRTYKISPELIDLVSQLKRKIYWLVLTEHWCGDASQILPSLNAIAEISEGMIEMKLVYRDQNVELMNSKLTNGSKSIPKLIQLDEEFNEIGIWGPRPMIAQELVVNLRANPLTTSTFNNQLHSWYARDKQRSLEKEIADLLMGAG